MPRMSRANAQELRDVEAVIFDFDGVFTDNRVVVFEDGREAVVCNRGDGLGLERLRSLGIPMVIMSTETNPVVSRRAEKLRLPVYQGLSDKAATLKKFAADEGLDLSRIAYVGNDINDAGCLEIVGMPVVVADAMLEVKSLARIVLKKKGGQGAVREFCDMLWGSRKNA